MLSYIDRANVGNARLFGAQADTGMSIISEPEGTTEATGLTDTEWNIGLSLLCKSRGAVCMGHADQPSHYLCDLRSAIEHSGQAIWTKDSLTYAAHGSRSGAGRHRMLQ
jgi:hypothetical protein